MNMNIYITKDNEKYLRTVKPSMSGYINGLIEVERGLSPALLKPEEYPSIINLEGVYDEKGEPKIVTLSNQQLSNGICKEHKVPLDSRGRCLQKGCKYA